jgi:hypothetical protein
MYTTIQRADPGTQDGYGVVHSDDYRPYYRGVLDVQAGDICRVCGPDGMEVLLQG